MPDYNYTGYYDPEVYERVSAILYKHNSFVNEILCLELTTLVMASGVYATAGGAS